MTIFSLISYFSTAILQNYINKIHQDMNAPCSKVGRLSLSCKMLFISRKSILLRCSLIWSSTRRNPAKYKTSATAPKIVPTEGTDSRAGISEREKTSKGLTLRWHWDLIYKGTIVEQRLSRQIKWQTYPVAFKIWYPDVRISVGYIFLDTEKR